MQLPIELVGDRHLYDAAEWAGRYFRRLHTLTLDTGEVMQLVSVLAEALAMIQRSGVVHGRVGMDPIFECRVGNEIKLGGFMNLREPGRGSRPRVPKVRAPELEWGK